MVVLASSVQVFASLLANTAAPLDFLFNTWQGAFFENDNFRNNFLTPMAIGLALTTAALFMLERRARFLGQPFSKKTVRTVGIVLTVLEKQEPTPEQLKQNWDKLRETLLQQKRQAMESLYVQNLRDQLEKQGKIKINKKEMDRLTNSSEGT